MRIKEYFAGIFVRLNQYKIVKDKTGKPIARALLRFHHREKYYYQIQIKRRAFPFVHFWQDVTSAENAAQVRNFCIDRRWRLH